MIINLISVKILWGGQQSSILKWAVIQGAGLAYTPDCLKEYATGSINGAMWTISVTIQFYIIIWFAYKILKKLNVTQWSILLGIMAIINIAFDFTSNSIVAFASRTIIPYMLWFGIGVFVYIYRRNAVPLLETICLPLIGVYVVYYIINQVHPLGIPGFYCSIVGGVLLPLITISVGYKSKIKINKDYTYGLYLYHWVVLNCMVQIRAFERTNWLICILGFVLSTFTLAMISQMATGKIIQAISCVCRNSKNKKKGTRNDL